MRLQQLPLAGETLAPKILPPPSWGWPCFSDFCLLGLFISAGQRTLLREDSLGWSRETDPVGARRGWPSVAQGASLGRVGLLDVSLGH